MTQHTGGPAFVFFLCFPGSTNSITLGGGRFLAILPCESAM